jgi:hypothetical protein
MGAFIAPFCAAKMLVTEPGQGRSTRQARRQLHRCAVAMSGNAFLPNTRFNLTANVSTYDGAHAGSFQVGAMVSDNVAVNAGMATGFNKGGKTAGRVGVTFGW